MIVARQCDTGRNSWSSSKLEGRYQNIGSPRMSDFEPLSNQPDWQEHFSAFSVPGETGLLPSSFEQRGNISPKSRKERLNAESSLQPHHGLPPLKQEDPPMPAAERLENTSNPIVNPIRDESSVSTGSTAHSLGSNQLSSVSSAPPAQSIVKSEAEAEVDAELKEEEDVEDADDDMFDMDEDSTTRTPAENRAARRKMKRFRLTHQQTRFLMSEFAKQAHPDAAHRERLSREIPGLSPRQVQVWFQNRRAKIKRLTVDDRERMMKMRAVPDDFDNLQALHSPYGVQGVATPLESPVEFVPTYADQMMRPLMLDTMSRNVTENHVSPTGLGAAFNHMPYSTGSLGNPDMLSPLSTNSTDRFYPQSHLSSPMSAGSRNISSFNRRNSYQALPNSRPSARSLQPLHLRDTASRTRSESIQSPLRSSMSWKGETLDYASYQAGQSSPQSNGRQGSLQSDQLGNINSHQYAPNIYPHTNLQTSSPQAGYSTSHASSNSLQQSSPTSLSRLRSFSSSIPPGLDLRAQYRTISSQILNQGSSQNPNAALSPSSQTASYTTAFTGGYPSAPLTAPIDFAIPRTTIEGGQNKNQAHTPGTRDYSVPQMSPSIVPPQDFTSAFSSGLGSGRPSIGIGARGGGHSDHGIASPRLGRFGQDLQQSKQPLIDNASYLRAGITENQPSRKRKRSFTMPAMFENP